MLDIWDVSNAEQVYHRCAERVRYKLAAPDLGAADEENKISQLP